MTWSHWRATRSDASAFMRTNHDGSSSLRVGLCRGANADAGACAGQKTGGPDPATTGRSRMTGLGQVNESQDAGYARGMSKVLY
jgi:hypothetical protein